MWIHTVLLDLLAKRTLPSPRPNSCPCVRSCPLPFVNETITHLKINEERLASGFLKNYYYFFFLTLRGDLIKQTATRREVRDCRPCKQSVSVRPSFPRSVHPFAHPAQSGDCVLQPEKKPRSNFFLRHCFF